MHDPVTFLVLIQCATGGIRSYRANTSGRSSHLAISLCYCSGHHRHLHSFPTRRSSDLGVRGEAVPLVGRAAALGHDGAVGQRSEEHTSELQSLRHLVCRLLLEKKKSKRLMHEYLLSLACNFPQAASNLLLQIEMRAVLM